MLGKKEAGTEWGLRAITQSRELLSGNMDESTQHDISVLYARAGKSLLRGGSIDAAIAMHRVEIELCRNLVAIGSGGEKIPLPSRPGARLSGTWRRNRGQG